MFGLADQAVDFAQRPPKFPPKIKKKGGGCGKIGNRPVGTARLRAPRADCPHPCGVGSRFSHSSGLSSFHSGFNKIQCIWRRV